MLGWRRFKSDERGTTATIFALTLLPVLGLMGAAVDYSRAGNARTELQKALDATALAMTREPTSLSQTQLQTKAQAVFRSVFHPDNLTAETSLRVTRTGKTVRVEGAAQVGTTILSMAGFDRVEITGVAEAAWGSRNIELALVLDNTGSMGRANKMSELIKAANRLVDQVQASAQSSDQIRISVVPFDTQVRLDPSLRNQSWLRPLTPDEIMKGNNKAPGAANAERGSWIQALPYAGSDETKARAAWEGYVSDRNLRRKDPVTGRVEDVLLNVRDTAPDRLRPETLYPMVRNEESQALAPIVPLTRDFRAGGALRNTINAMRPRGCTDITLGAMWGLETLSPAEPFSQGVAFGTQDVEKIMILLTDGWNTRDAFSNVCGVQEGNPVLDGRTESACNTVKSRGVVLYTIKVIEGSDALLGGCASRITDPSSPYFRRDGKAELYYPVTDASQLSGVFETIINQILATRLTH